MAKTRTRRKFSWEAVDPEMIRGLLLAFCRARPTAGDPADIRRATDASLQASAQSMLGSPPHKEALEEREVIDFLRTKWLPKAPPKVVDEIVSLLRLTLGGAALLEPVNSNRQQIRFLRKRRVTANLQRELRKAFINCHKLAHKINIVEQARNDLLAGPFDLAGRGEPNHRSWYNHQVAAHTKLDQLMADSGRLRGALVLPTGAGKTDTIVGWLIPRMEANPKLRVLWLVHQQELAEQAMTRFQAMARHEPRGFRRVGRVIHGRASSHTALSDPGLSVATATYQTFMKLDRGKRQHIENFLSRPCVVIVDEAHHAGAPSYHDLLDTIERQPEVQAVIGLTATPYPTSSTARSRFDKRFPTRIHEVSTIDLIDKNILAMPIVTTVETGQAHTLSESQLAQANATDIPAEVLRELDNHNRNQLVVSRWTNRSEDWGKTLLFATGISHADTFRDLLRSRDADVRVMHSRSGNRSSTLDWFRRGNAGQPKVLVSVGMLTEGIDLPDARTAFLARPTTSPILMRQMVGRVLRGLPANGEATSNVVYFSDDWKNVPDVLYPDETLPLSRREGTRDWAPGPIVTDDDIRMRDDLAARIQRAHDHLAGFFNLEDDDPYNDLPPTARVEGSKLIGYYDVDDFPIPVLDHQVDAFERLLADAVYDLKGTAFLSYFDDTPPPFPTLRALKSLVESAREQGEPPPLTRCEATLGPGPVVQQILDAGALTDAARAKLIGNHYSKTLNRHSYPSLLAFEEAVDRMLRERRQPNRPLNPESGVARGLIDQSLLPRLPRKERQIKPLLDQSIKRAREVLPPSYAARLAGKPPGIDWTTRAVASTFAHWTLRLTGRGKGKSMIRVNRLLSTSPSIVTDEMLAYLIYHELLHHLLPTQGHDAEFRDLEAQWPNSAELDLAFDTLHEKWDTRPERYNGSSKL